MSTQAKRFPGDNLGPYNVNSAEVLEFGLVLLIQGYLLE